MLAVGEILQSRYRIERPLQEGGMSVVYLGWDTSLSTRVAVKEMVGRFTSEAQRAASVVQFKQEAQMLARLDHHGLPRVTNFFEEAGSYYLAMDFIDGDSLERALQRYGPVPEDLVLVWTYEICQVLDYLHHLQPPIIFRDLKPSNVMLGRNGHVKLIDFGISKIFDLESGTKTVIRGSGTPGFAPPEQYGARADHRTDARSDIYALGMTMWRLLTGEEPPDATTRLMLDVPILNANVYNEGLSEGLNSLIARMCMLSPDKRYQSAKEAMQDVLAILGGNPPSLDPLELPEGMLDVKAEEPAPFEKDGAGPPTGAGLIYQTVMENSVDGIIVADSSSKIVLTNRALEEILGYPPGGLNGRSLGVIQPERYRKRHDEGLKRFVETRVPRVVGITVEIEALRKDGTEIPIELSVGFKQIREAVYFVAVIKDITERRQRDEKVGILLKRQEEAVRSMRLLHEMCRHPGMDRLSPTLSSLAEDLQLTQAAVFLREPGDGKLSLVAHVGEIPEAVEWLTLVVQEAMSSSTPVFTNSALSHRGMDRYWVSQYRVTSMALLPLANPGGRYGVVAIFRHLPLEDHEREFLSCFASVLTLSVANIDLMRRAAAK